MRSFLATHETIIETRARHSGLKANLSFRNCYRAKKTSFWNLELDLVLIEANCTMTSVQASAYTYILRLLSKHSWVYNKIME